MSASNTVASPHLIIMKKILDNPKIQFLIAVLVLLLSYVISSLQGIFGFFLPIIILITLILIMIFVYYVVSLPLLNKFVEDKKDNVYSLEQIKHIETTGNFKEIWIATSDLKMPTSKEFVSIITKNIKRNIKYVFFTKDTILSRGRSQQILDIHNTHGIYVTVIFFRSDPIFIDGNTDYDLFFSENPMDSTGFIGITINNIRNYIMMPQELFYKLKNFLENEKEWQENKTNNTEINNN